MILELRGHHNERLCRIDTRDYAHCEGIFIEVTPPDLCREHFPFGLFPEWRRPTSPPRHDKKCSE
jgi:hypothetical protein